MKKMILLGAALLITSLSAQSNEYTVVKDDNLWNISGDHLNDPYQWQRIWNENTYIENPDLIYPGDKIRIPGYQSGTASGDTMYTAQDAPVASTFNDKVAGLAKEEDVKVVEQQPVEEAPKPMTALEAYFRNRSDLYSVARRRSAPYIVSSNGEKDYSIGLAEIQDDSRQVYGMNSIVTIVVDEGEAVAVGDVYEIDHIVGEGEYKERKVGVIEPRGSAVVTTVMGDSARIRITEAWDMIRSGDRIRNVRIFKKLQMPQIKKDVTPLDAKLLTRIDGGVAIKPYEVIIMDSGKDRGIMVGDLFEGYFVRKKEGPEHEPCIRGIVITVDENSAAMIIQEVYKHTGDGEYDLSRYGQLVFK